MSRGSHIFRVGDNFQAVYAVRSGSVKTYTLGNDGNEQVTGFHLPGELVGLDAISTDEHPCAAITLETTSLCPIPFTQLQALSSSIPSLGKQMLRIMSKEILTDEHHLMILGKKSAEERLASMLLSLSKRFHQRGFSATEFNLTMSRNDIGNYLGLAVETVSRVFTRFQEQQILSAQRKFIQIHQITKLQEISGACNDNTKTSNSANGRNN